MTDDMGWGDVGYNGGYAETPNLDDMAAGKHTIRFDNFYAGASVCSPTRASVLTGRTPNRHCIWSANKGHLQDTEFTVFKAAKQAGYATSHFGKWHLGAFNSKVFNDQCGDKTESSPGTHGADWWYSTQHAVPTATPNCACFSPVSHCMVGSKGGDSIGSCGSKNGNAPGVDVNYFYPDPNGKYDGISAESQKIPGDDSDWLYSQFEKWLRSTLAEDASRPFLSVIWWHPPHKDFIATDAMYKHYTEKGDGGSMADYLGSITGVDAAIGKVRTLLASLDVAENTAIFFTSDNGALNGSPGGQKANWHPGLRGYKHDMTEGGIRVPGLLEWPAQISSNRVTRYPAATMDYLPTLMDILGISHPHPSWPVDGESLMPFINGAVESRTSPIGHIFGQSGEWGKGKETPWDAWGPVGDQQREGKQVKPSSAPSGMSEAPELKLKEAAQLSWRVGDLKLYAWRSGIGNAWEYALFDISKDESESENIADQQSSVFKQMFKDMWLWAEGVYESQQSETHCSKSFTYNSTFV